MTTAISSRQLGYLTSLLETREWESTGKTISINGARFRANPEKISEISKAVASRMIDALQTAPARADKLEIENKSTAWRHEPHFACIRGEWIIACPRPGWDAGDVVEVKTRSGIMKKVQITDHRYNLGGLSYRTEIWENKNRSYEEERAAFEAACEKEQSKYPATHAEESNSEPMATQAQIDYIHTLYERNGNTSTFGAFILPDKPGDATRSEASAMINALLED